MNSVTVPPIIKDRPLTDAQSWMLFVTRVLLKKMAYMNPLAIPCVSDLRRTTSISRYIDRARPHQ